MILPQDYLNRLSENLHQFLWQARIVLKNGRKNASLASGFEKGLLQERRGTIKFEKFRKLNCESVEEAWRRRNFPINALDENETVL